MVPRQQGLSVRLTSWHKAGGLSSCRSKSPTTACCGRGSPKPCGTVLRSTHLGPHPAPSRCMQNSTPQDAA
eukprot:356865-Chlamydomonas_euryale.AAC.7